MKKWLLFAAILALPVMVQAQMTVRPPVLTAPKVNMPPPEATPEWLKEVTQLKARVSQLEGQLNQTRQELTAFRQEYGSHTHAGCKPSLVWNNAGGKTQIMKWAYCDHVATGNPIQAEPFSSLQ